MGAPSSVSLEEGAVPKYYQVTIKSVYHLENTETYIVSQNKRRKVAHECRLPDLSAQPESLYPVASASAAGSTRSLPLSGRTRSSQSSLRGSSASLGALSTGTSRSGRSGQGQGTTRGRGMQQTPRQSGTPSSNTRRSPATQTARPSATPASSTRRSPAAQTSQPSSVGTGTLAPSVHPMDAQPSGSLGLNILLGAEQLASEEQLQPDIATAEQLEGAGLAARLLIVKLLLITAITVNGVKT